MLPQCPKPTRQTRAPTEISPPVCPICWWRRQKLRTPDPDYTDAPPQTCDCTYAPLLPYLHEYPGEVWTDIIDTGMLMVGETRVREGRIWMVFPIWPSGAPQPDSPPTCACGLPNAACGACGRGWAQEQARRERTRELQDHTHELQVPEFCVDGEWHTALVPGFHNTKLENLVRPQEYQARWNLPLLGRGILHDQRLRYGRCSHGGKSGVNVYSQDTGAALDSFLGCTGWVQLELRCHSLSKLRGGAAHRYCITGPAGDVCNKAHLFALWVPGEEVPWMLRLA